MALVRTRMQKMEGGPKNMSVFVIGVRKDGTASKGAVLDAGEALAP